MANNTKYNIEVKFETKWEFLHQSKTLKEAYGYMSRMKSHKYPFRIIRVVRSIVFEEKK